MPRDADYSADCLQQDIEAVSRETLERLQIYADLLVKWNKSINLVSRDSLGDLWRRHFLDSAQLFHLLRDTPARDDLTLLDLGSGAGFPGIILARGLRPLMPFGPMLSQLALLHHSLSFWTTPGLFSLLSVLTICAAEDRAIQKGGISSFSRAKMWIMN